MRREKSQLKMRRDSDYSISRRRFLSAAGASVATVVSSRASSVGLSGSYSLVIRNGRAFVRGRWSTPDIGVTRGGRLKIAPAGSLQAREILEANGLVVSPGFIDILADGVVDGRRAYKIFEQYKLMDGVTTVLQMHGGTDQVDSFYSRFEELPHFTHYGVSTKVMRIRARHAEVQDRLRQVEECLDDGALGVSHSLEYQPTPWEELVEYARLAKKYDRPFFLHLRYSSPERELHGVAEGIRLARLTGVRLHIDHLHSTGGTFHMEEALSTIREAVDSGLRITACVYPYTYWATYLHSRRFDEGWKERYGLDYSDLRVVGTNEQLNEESFNRYRKEAGILVSVPEGSMPLESGFDLAIQEDFCLVASDGGIVSTNPANNHPRGAGCFATSIRRALQIGMPLEKILAKLTVGPREVLEPSLQDRGILRNGRRADLTIFDPSAINGRATVANPAQASEGIRWVLVNGRVAYDGQKTVASLGEAVRATSESGPLWTVAPLF